jgi:hypothetical protein
VVNTILAAEAPRKKVADGVSVCSSCSHNVLRLGHLYRTEVYFLPVLEAVKSSIEALLYNEVLPTASSPGGKWKGKRELPLLRAPNAFMGQEPNYLF